MKGTSTLNSSTIQPLIRQVFLDSTLVMAGFLAIVALIFL